VEGEDIGDRRMKHRRAAESQGRRRRAVSRWVREGSPGGEAISPTRVTQHSTQHSTRLGPFATPDFGVPMEPGWGCFEQHASRAEGASNTPKRVA
jgi:hypothetical protein